MAYDQIKHYRRRRKKSTKKTGISTTINSAAILDILERFSGHTLNGEIVKLRIETPAKSLDRAPGIKELLKNEYGISLKVDTIRSNITELERIFPKIKRNRYYYWIEKTNVLDSGEYKILKAKIESDNSLNATEKESLIRKIDSIASSGYSKELGYLDSTPTSNIDLLGNKNIKKSIETITFRDFLRSNPEAVKKYSLIKEKAAELFPHDIDGYIEYKSPCIEELYKECGLK